MLYINYNVTKLHEVTDETVHMSWSRNNYMKSNARKTKEMVISFTKPLSYVSPASDVPWQRDPSMNVCILSSCLGI